MQSVFEGCVAGSNIAALATGSGFRLVQSSNCRISGCEATNNGNDFTEGFGFVCSEGNNNLINNCQANSNGNASGTDASGFMFSSETASTIIDCTSSGQVGSGSVHGILLGDDGTGVYSQNCVIQHNTVSNNYVYGIRDTLNLSTSLITGNLAFNQLSNYDVTYAFGLIPTDTGSLTTGFPPTGSTGTFDNVSISA